jgi:hypothetical protein
LLGVALNREGFSFPVVTGIKKYSKIGNDSAVKTATMLQ